MISEQEPISFGHYLKNIRLKKEISLDAISEETCIRQNLLCLIEKEAYEQLPEEVFVKGFLRAYAKVIGADGEEAVRLYLSGINNNQTALEDETDSLPVIEPEREKDVLGSGAEKNILKTAAEKKENNKKVLMGVLLVIGILIGMALLTILIIPVLQDRYFTADDQIKPSVAVNQNSELLPSETSPASDKEILEPDSSEVADVLKEKGIQADSKPLDISDTNNEINAEAARLSPTSDADETADSQQKPLEKLSLKIKAIKRTWLRVKRDGGSSKYYNLKKGDNLELEASSDFYLIIGSGRRVELTLNDKPITDFANKKGRVEFSLP